MLVSVHRRRWRVIVVAGALTLKLQSCISIMTSQPKADQNLREVGGEGWRVTNHRTKSRGRECSR